jgi:hypothetical protein
VVEINSSNFEELVLAFDETKMYLEGGRGRELTREIFTDCERACDNDNFVLGSPLATDDNTTMQRHPHSHITRALA